MNAKMEAELKDKEYDMIWLGYLEEGRACIPVGHET